MLCNVFPNLVKTLLCCRDESSLQVASVELLLIQISNYFYVDECALETGAV